VVKQRAVRAAVGIATLVLWLAPVSTASAGLVRTATSVDLGPVLAGDQAVWAENPDGGPLTIHAAGPGGRDRIVFSEPWAAGTHQWLERLDASGSRIVLQRHVSDAGGYMI
jgi:hypothetical protein